MVMNPNSLCGLKSKQLIIFDSSKYGALQNIMVVLTLEINSSLA